MTGAVPWNSRSLIVGSRRASVAPSRSFFERSVNRAAINSYDGDYRTLPEFGNGKTDQAACYANRNRSRGERV
jgi:hypothetical protein